MRANYGKWPENKGVHQAPTGLERVSTPDGRTSHIKREWPFIFLPSYRRFSVGGPGRTLCLKSGSVPYQDRDGPGPQKILPGIQDPTENLGYSSIRDEG